jgi:hypothetical protein
MKQNRVGEYSAAGRSLPLPYFAFVFAALGQRASRKLVLASPGHRLTSVVTGFALRLHGFACCFFGCLWGTM